MSDKIRVLIVDDLAETRENVRKLLQFESDVEVIAQAGSGEEALEMAKEHRPDIILMDINMPGLDGISASQAIVQAVPSTQIVIMSVQSEADYLRRAMLAGARDFLMKPFSGDELISAVRRVHQMRPASARRGKAANGTEDVQYQIGEAQQDRKERDAGRIVTVYSPKGGTGSTVLAVNLAVAIADQGHRTLLVDCSLQFGDVAVMLNLRPTRTLVDLVERMTDLEMDLISSVVSEHKASGLRVLLAPNRPEMADLVTADSIRTVLQYVQDHFDYIVVDTHSSLDEVTLAVLDIAHQIILVAQPSLPALKNTSRFYDVAETLDYDREKITLVVNNVTNGVGISTKDIAGTLKRPVELAIPSAPRAVSRSIDQGQPLVLARHKEPVSSALISLAEQTVRALSPEATAGRKEQEEGEKLSFWQRLFGRRFGVAR
ncbi:MAG: response regulator [Candidatus Promineifilaceae bacterium]|nr:response regulator [Candidatus Promineifilaceae bacterium]